MKRAAPSIAASLIVMSLAYCIDSTTEPDDDNAWNERITRLEAAHVERVQQPAVDSATVDELVGGNSAFALDMYHALSRQYDNVFFSPYSISQCLAMTYAGARGETAGEMAQALSFSAIEDSMVHSAFNALDLSLMQAHQPDSGVTLSIVNTTWGQTGWPFTPSYMNTLARHYGAGVNCLDFQRAPDSSRMIINGWVYEETNELIEDLLPRGSIDMDTRFVLTNAIHFFGTWLHQFDKRDTRETTFYLTDGSTTGVDMMHLPETTFPYYAAGNGPDAAYQALQLPYTGKRLAMLVLLPARDSFDNVEQRLTGNILNKIMEGFDSTELVVELPRFSFTTETMNISSILQGLGMQRAFTGQADFSGIDSTGSLYISDVFHKAYVKVNEEGTEAAAATATGMKMVSMPLTFRADRPFIFCIQDTYTNTIVFMGRVKDPGHM
jgi:serpin B